MTIFLAALGLWILGLCLVAVMASLGDDDGFNGIGGDEIGTGKCKTAGRDADHAGLAGKRYGKGYRGTSA